jgi:hypothetical protein
MEEAVQGLSHASLFYLGATILIQNLCMKEGPVGLTSGLVDPSQREKYICLAGAEALAHGNDVSPPGGLLDRQGAICLGHHQGKEGIGTKAQMGQDGRLGHQASKSLKKPLGTGKISGAGADPVDQVQVDLVKACLLGRGEALEQSGQGCRVREVSQTPTHKEHREARPGRRDGELSEAVLLESLGKGRACVEPFEGLLQGLRIRLKQGQGNIQEAHQAWSGRRLEEVVEAPGGAL